MSYFLSACKCNDWGLPVAAVERKKFVKKCAKPFAALLCLLMACLGLYLALSVSSSTISSQPGPYITGAADYLPVVIPDMPVMVTTPATAEPLAETGGVPPTMSQALAVSLWHNRLPARPAADFDWVGSPLQLSSGPEVPETAAELSGRQPAALALGSSVPGLQSVLLGVRDVTPDVFGFVPLILSSVLSRIPAIVPRAVDTSLDGAGAPASWQQHSVPKGFCFPTSCW